MQMDEVVETDRPSVRAQRGLQLIEVAIVDLLSKHDDGLSNAEIAEELGLQTSGKNGQRNYLTWSVLQKLTNEMRIQSLPRPGRKSGILYRVSKGAPL